MKETRSESGVERLGKARKSMLRLKRTLKLRKFHRLSLQQLGGTTLFKLLRKIGIAVDSLRPDRNGPVT